MSQWNQVKSIILSPKYGLFKFVVVVQSVMSDCFAPHGLQHARLCCPSPRPGVCSNSHPLSQWCHQTISSYVAPFSSCPQAFPASGCFPLSRLFASGGHSIEASASASFLLMNIQGWFPLRLTIWTPCCSSDSQEFSTTPQFKCIKSLVLIILYLLIDQISDFNWIKIWKEIRESERVKNINLSSRLESNCDYLLLPYMLYPCWPPYSYQNSHLEFKIQCIFNSVWKLFPVTKFYLLFFLRICVNNFIKVLEKYIGLTGLDFSFSRRSSLKSLFSQLFPMGWHLDIQYVSGLLLLLTTLTLLSS